MAKNFGKKSARAQEIQKAAEAEHQARTAPEAAPEAAPEVLAQEAAPAPEAAPETPAPATLPVLAPVQKGKAAPYMQQVRELLTGEGHPVATLCEKLGLSDKDARGVIDAIRAKEGKQTVLNIFSEKAGRKVFRYVGLDGKGVQPKAEG